MRIGVSSYSYIRLLNDGKFTLFDVIDHAAGTGFDMVEFIDLKPNQEEDIREYAKRIFVHAENKGIKVAAYTVDADFLNKPGGPENEKSRLMRCVDVAAALGASILRHDAVWKYKGGYREAADIVAPHIRAVTEYAESLGIKTVCENHGHFMQESHRVEYLIRKVNHPNFGVLVDIGNFLCADESPLTAVGRLAPYATHAHAKDFIFKNGAEPSPGEGWFISRGGHHLRGTILGHGVVQVAQCVNILKNTGYTGDISLEFEGPEEVLPAIRAGYTYLKKITE